MKRFVKDRKFLIGLTLSMVLAMAVGSFALGEAGSGVETQASPQVENQSVAATNDGTGDFAVTGDASGYSFDSSSGVLTISGGNHTISMAQGKSVTNQRIEVTGAATITLAGVNIEASTGAALAITDNAAFNVNILLADESTNKLKGKVEAGSVDSGSPGIQKNGDTGVGTLTIGIPDGSQGTGKLEVTGGAGAAGIGSSSEKSTSNITITGSTVMAKGGEQAAGIGSGFNGIGSNITISGSVVTAKGGEQAAGIGGGAIGAEIHITDSEVIAEGGTGGAGIGSGDSSAEYSGPGEKIYITDSVVTATGGAAAAGIGGGATHSGNEIEITGGVVKATGRLFNSQYSGAGIGGGGFGGTGSNNKISGNAVVIAVSGGQDKGKDKEALEGFGAGSINQAIVFTGMITDYSTDPYTIDWKDGRVYGDATLLSNLKIPTDLIIPKDQSLTINQGIILTVPDKMVLQNEGTLTIKGTITCEYDEQLKTTGKVTTKTDFYLTDGSKYGDEDYYQTYQTNAGTQKYKDLPNPDDPTLLKSRLNSDKFENWYYINEDEEEVAIKNGDSVLLNEHKFYEYRVSEKYTITIDQIENGTITPDVTEAAKGDEVSFTITPDEGYELKDGSVTVKDKDGNEIPVTEKDGKYTFTMPGSGVEIGATFEKATYKISIDQPEHGTINPDKDEAKKGDEVSFTITPDEGYELKEGSVTVKDKDGNEIPLTEKDGKYTFKMPGSGVEIGAIFEEATYKISIDQPEHGTVTVDPENPRGGDEVIITLRPDGGYDIDGLPTVKTEDGTSVEVTPTGNPNEYKFTMPNGNVTLGVNFVPIPSPEPGPEPTPEPTPEPIPDPSVDPGQGGDGSGSGASSKTGDPFMGGVAFALLGVATTGAVLVRKRK